MSAESQCPICGSVQFYETQNIQTASHSLICEECENNEDVMGWYNNEKRKEAENYRKKWGESNAAKDCRSADS